MNQPDLFLDLLVAIASALVGGAIAARLRLPVLLGYLVSGVLIGPHALGWIHDPAAIDKLAQIGVEFLMFALGVEFSLSQLKPMWRLALGGGAVQILGTVGLTALVFRLCGFRLPMGVAIGCILSLSSTALVMRVLTERGETEAAYGRVLLSLLIVQDLAVLPMVLLLPGVAGPGLLSWPFWRALGLGVLFVAAALGFGVVIVPRIIARVAALGSQEVFFLTVVVLCLGLAQAAQWFGVSIAIGAFLAGVVVSEAPQSKQALADVLPLRDLFATLFFVSLGMLFDPGLALAHWPLVAMLLIGIVIGKTLLGAFAARLGGYSGRTALGVGLGLAQIGEFSFVLAGIASRLGLLPSAWFAAILGSSILSLMLGPFWIAWITPLSTTLARVPLVKRWLYTRPSAELAERPPLLRNHVVIAGYGRMGLQVGKELRRWQVPFLAVDLNHRLVEAARARGVQVIYGDAARPEILRHCQLERARLLIITLPDAKSAELCLIEAKRVAPQLEAIVRGHRASDAAVFFALGAKTVIQPEYEASIEAIRRALLAFGFAGEEVDHYLRQTRTRRFADYRAFPEIDLVDILPHDEDGTDLRWLPVLGGSPLSGATIREVEDRPEFGVVVLGLKRDNRLVSPMDGMARLRDRDEVLVFGTCDSLSRFEGWAKSGGQRLAGGNETG